MRLTRPLAVGLALLALGNVASAQGASPSEATVASAPTPPAELELSGQQRLSDADYAAKKEGGYLTGLPLVNYDPNTGVGFGARAYYYFDGARSDPLFAYLPYVYRMFLQIFFTTGGLQYHWFDLDARRVGDTPFRFRAQITFQRNTDQHYFGIGSETMDRLHFSGSPDQFSSFEDYHAALDSVDASGQTYARYDSYRLVQPMALLSLERPIWDGSFRPMVGLGLSYNDVHDYTGSRVEDSPGGTAVRAPTRLYEDCQAQSIEGCEGGWNNFLRLGLSFDTRDYDPDPNQGVFIDAALDLGTRVLGSQFNWARFMLAPRAYVSILPSLTDLVLAVRGTFQVQSHSVPFFGMNLIPYTEEPRNGLGGLRTLRGFQQDRFVGPVMTLANAELRWTFVRFDVLEQKFAIMAVPFVDLGAVYDRVSDIELSGWKRSQGLAMRIAWNLATIITAEYGTSAEDSGLYINFNHIF